MKLKTLIALQSIIEERKIPIDMEEEHYYYSHSKDEFKDILEMDLHHFIRAFKKLNETQDREEEIKASTISYETSIKNTAYKMAKDLIK